MASWFEKNIARPVKDFLRGDRAVQQDEMAAVDNQTTEMIRTMQAATGAAMAQNVVDALKDIELQGTVIKADGAIEKSDSTATSTPIEVDTDKGSRYLVLIAIIGIIYLVKKL
jgi:hypothetical protein